MTTTEQQIVGVQQQSDYDRCLLLWFIRAHARHTAMVGIHHPPLVLSTDW